VSSANNLRNIIRIIAELSSNKDNDHFFLNTNLIGKILFLNNIEKMSFDSDLLFQTISRIDIATNLESIGYFCTTLKNLTVNNELICLISEKKPFGLLKNILKNLLQVI
jgi:hypothetical protein